MQNRKSIAVVLSRPDEPMQCRFMQLLGREAAKNNVDVSVFAIMLRTYGYTEYSDGERKIIDLINLDSFDAIIVLPDTLQLDDNFAKETLDYLKANYKGILISFDYEVDGLPSFEFNDVDVADVMIQHLIEVHGYRDIAYMTGFKEHPHSQARLLGYRNALERAGIEYDESRVFYGDFWYDAGERVVQELIDSPKGIPQAIACANDNMMVSVYRALESRGIRVPEDVAVVGFDGETGLDAERFITSTQRNVEDVVIRMMEYLYGKWGLDYEKPIPEKDNLLMIHRSCGCERRQSIRLGSKDFGDDSLFHSLYNFMQEEMLETANLSECVWRAAAYADHIGNYDCLYMCLSENWAAMDPEQHGYDEQKDDLSEMLIPALAVRSCDIHEKHVDAKVDLESRMECTQMLPVDRPENEPSRVYYYNMLHFGKHLFGYMILQCDPGDCMMDGRYPFWVRNISNSLESLRRVYAVNDLYYAAEHKAITDAMTGLYNRNGYVNMMPKIIREMQSDDQLMIALCDNNGLKYINDNFGHVAGDEMICLTARILSVKIFGEEIKEWTFRIGGDEYVKVAVGKLTDAHVEQFVEYVHSQEDKVNKQNLLQHDCPFYLAMGTQLFQRNEIHSMDQVMRKPDKLMYDNKQEIKRMTGFDPVRRY